MLLCKYSCKAGTYNCTITRWEQLSRQQFCRERYRATVNHRANESTILGWCKNDKHHIRLKKLEYYRLEKSSDFSNLLSTGKSLAGSLDLDLSTESIQNRPQRKRNKKPLPNQNRIQKKKLDLDKWSWRKRLYCLNSITKIKHFLLCGSC